MPHLDLEWGGQQAWPEGHGRAWEAGPGAARRTGMIDWSERKAYWRHTKLQMLTSLLPFLAAVIVPPLYAEERNNSRVLGIPLRYFFACHGLLVIAFVTVAVFINRQVAIDHWHGAHED